MTFILRRLRLQKRKYSSFDFFSACETNILINQKRLSHVKPGQISLTCTVPSHIQKPAYVADNFWFLKNKYNHKNKIEIKNNVQINGMKDACRLARQILNYAGSLVEAGVTTDGLDRKVHDEIIDSNAYPSPLLYKGFPKSICTSVNNVACHGIPDDRELLEGDIINIDITVFYNGFHGDCSETFIVGETTAENEWLIEMTRECRDLAIEICGPGIPFKNIGKTIGNHAKEWRFEVVPVFCGHGIGEFFHGPPDILHVDNDMEGVMQTGMTFTIEPILAGGSGDTHILEDGWTAVTVDGNNTAQFEHTILITDNGAEILT